MGLIPEVKSANYCLRLGQKEMKSNQEISQKKTLYVFRSQK